MFQGRQGDILVEEVKKCPPGLKKLETNVIAYGEVTGHAHVLDCDSFAASGVAENGDIFVKSPSAFVLSHDEHGSIECPPKRWIKFTRQREYDPLAAEKERKVAD